MQHTPSGDTGVVSRQATAAEASSTYQELQAEEEKGETELAAQSQEQIDEEKELASVAENVLRNEFKEDAEDEDEIVLTQEMEEMLQKDEEEVREAGDTVVEGEAQEQFLGPEPPLVLEGAPDPAPTAPENAEGVAGAEHVWLDAWPDITCAAKAEPLPPDGCWCWWSRFACIFCRNTFLSPFNHSFQKLFIINVVFGLLSFCHYCVCHDLPYIIIILSIPLYSIIVKA